MATKPETCEALAESFQRGIQQVEDAADCKWVDDAITALGKSNKEVAAQLQKSESAISRWRNGERGVQNKAVLFVTFAQLAGGAVLRPYQPTLEELAVGGYLQVLNDARDGIRRKRAEADRLIDTVRFFRLQVLGQLKLKAELRGGEPRSEGLAEQIGAEADRRAAAIRHRHPAFLAPPPPATADSLTALVAEWREAWQQLFDCIDTVPGVTDQ